MKKLFTICAAFCITASLFAQAPEKMSYQAVIRDGSNVLVASSSVGMQISILQGSPSGTAVYVETQTPTSNANGLVSIEIGGGTAVSGTFASIDWANGPYFVKTETDPTGGTSYSITGTSQLLSVPYALHAKNTDSWSVNADTTYSMKRVGIGTTSPEDFLDVQMSASSQQSGIQISAPNTVGLGSQPAINFKRGLLTESKIFGTGNSISTSSSLGYMVSSGGAHLFYRNSDLLMRLDSTGSLFVGNGASYSIAPIDKRRLTIVAGNNTADSCGVRISATGGLLNKSTFLELGEATNATLGIRLFLNGSSNYLSIQTSNGGFSDVITIPYAGSNKDYVGIGTTTPQRKLHISDVMRLEPRSTIPTNPAEGDIYMDSTTHKLMVYDGTTWQPCW